MYKFIKIFNILLEFMNSYYMYSTFLKKKEIDFLLIQKHIIQSMLMSIYKYMYKTTLPYTFYNNENKEETVFMLWCLRCIISMFTYRKYSFLLPHGNNGKYGITWRPISTMRANYQKSWNNLQNDDDIWRQNGIYKRQRGVKIDFLSYTSVQIISC